MEQLLEVSKYLRDVKAEVRQFAVQTLADYCASEEAQKLLLTSDTLVKDLCLLISDDTPIAKHAYLCLVHLSADSEFSDRMLEAKIISRLMGAIMDKENKLVELSCMLMCNLSRRVEGVRALLQLGTDMEGLHLHKLIQRFCMPPSAASLESDDAKDPYIWLASVFMNVSQMEEGRKLLLEKKSKSILYLLPFLSHPHPMRTRGVMGVFRNCCCDAVDRTWLLSADVDALRYILIPAIRHDAEYSEADLKKLPATVGHKYEQLKAIAKSGEKVPVPDEETASTLVEVLCLLSQETKHKDILKQNGVYAIIREMDRLGVKSEDTQERLVALALRLVEEELQHALKGSTVTQEPAKLDLD